MKNGKELPCRSTDEDFTLQCRGLGSIPGWRAKIPHAPVAKNKNKNIKQKQYCKKFNKDLKKKEKQG